MAVSIVFHGAGPWGAGVGRLIFATEADANLYALKLAIEDLQDNPPSAVGISSIVQTGDNITIWLTNASSQGPFALPTASPLTKVDTIAGASYTLALPDRAKFWLCTNAGGCVVSIPAAAEVDFPVGTEFIFQQDAAGAISFDSSTDVDLTAPAGFLFETATLGAVVQIKKLAADRWHVFGLLAADEVTA